MEETIYVVDDDDEEEEVVKVCNEANCQSENARLNKYTDYQEAVGNVICQGLVLVLV